LHPSRWPVVGLNVDYVLHGKRERGALASELELPIDVTDHDH
jgi:hypothetical protein